MKNFALKLMLVVLSLQLISCKKEKENGEKDKTTDVSVASDTIFSSGNPYYTFIQKNNPNVLKENKLIYFKEEDIDLDGKKEAIVALGEVDKDNILQTSVSDLFLLRNDNGIIKKLAYNFGKDTYFINEVEIIKLQGKRESCIYLGLTNSSNLEGFSLFELIDNKLKNFCYSASGSGVGEDSLVDKDHNGIYDGYVQFRSNMDVLYYEVDAHYVFKDNVFKHAETHVEISPDYPDGIEEVLLQYISLRSLDFGESKEVNKRLKLICKDQTADALKWNKTVWAQAYIANYLGFEKKINFDIDLQEVYEIATATFIDDHQKEYQCQFTMEMTNYKWQIIKVELL